MSRKRSGKKTNQNPPRRPPASQPKESLSRDHEKSTHALQSPSWGVMEVVLAAVALGLTIGLVFSCHKGRSDLLLEQEAHERTRTELADVKKANAELQRNLATTRALHPILELYGAGFSVYQSFDIRAEQGATSRFGRCGNQGCYNIQLRE
ncbi:MAG TPA: hypothetical protein VIH59_10130, partial [Candidatus Tectomicrobia bacterium]